MATRSTVGRALHRPGADEGEACGSPERQGDPCQTTPCRALCDRGDMESVGPRTARRGGVMSSAGTRSGMLAWMPGGWMWAMYSRRKCMSNAIHAGQCGNGGVRRGNKRKARLRGRNKLAASRGGHGHGVGDSGRRARAQEQRRQLVAGAERRARPRHGSKSQDGAHLVTPRGVQPTTPFRLSAAACFLVDGSLRRVSHWAPRPRMRASRALLARKVGMAVLDLAGPRCATETQGDAGEMKGAAGRRSAMRRGRGWAAAADTAIPAARLCRGAPGRSHVANAIPGPEAGRGSSPKASLPRRARWGRPGAGRRLRLRRLRSLHTAASSKAPAPASGMWHAALEARPRLETGASAHSSGSTAEEAPQVPARVSLARELKPKPGSRGLPPTPAAVIAANGRLVLPSLRASRAADVDVPVPAAHAGSRARPTAAAAARPRGDRPLVRDALRSGAQDPER
ncbi:hypothetical protein K505DRAFT_334786 [Melanomma pulvis-pyrius CBS 109.77]|uniref:Uncharacterized protein n=1 Tax=Melanomma pulvis-pyrius CBS 109.77 TaxID=1314802 RepID=A0A6A6XKU5_9PLEO|nr:hypothetical protein K505DRAFT_334786 [Melanomma pulvis-pyrius CBS 109.77]